MSLPAFVRRAAALDALELRDPDRRDLSLAAQARRLERRQARVLERLAARIRAGRYRHQGLRRALARCAGEAGGPGYDALDALLSGLLEAGPLAAPRVALGPEGVAYQPTPGREILALLDQAALGPEDRFCDLGSGLGRVPILVALLSGARCGGVELEPAYVDYARASARRLALDVDFVAGDARDAPLMDANVYFLYTPFQGAVLDQVLERLRAEARQRPLRICGYGPCNDRLGRQDWLRPPADGWRGHAVALFRSRG